ncbi:MAG: type I polyketide synthase, partial [Hyphomicrobiaceae bacterium]
MSRIAIVGIGCRFPGGVRDPAGYWSLLSSARCAIGEIPPDRWSLDGFYDPSGERPDRSYCKWGGFLEEIRRFDPGFFGLSPREVEAMDPQQRILLQVAVEAAQDAMMPVSALRAASAGVVVGLSNADYSLMQRYRRGPGDIQAGTGTALSIVANRISNRLDLGGPSMGVDTACSSSLVAVDIACRYLADGTCGAVLAGGVNILLDPRMFLTFCRARMLSPSGRIRAFDARADGFVRGEGVGVVVLKRLEDAESAGDRIYAVIEATAVNQDGATGTITEPDREAQIAMLRKAAAQADIGPGELDYAEAHGTGTPVGDPIEATAIGSVFGGPERLGPLLIGSAKTNIGHLEPAAGIAGLIKAALVMHHRQVPPSLGYERPNPSIAFDELNLQVADKFVPLAADGRPLHALVNSFGFGGTNACVVLSSAGGSSGKMSTAGGMGRVSSARGEVRPLPLPLSAPSQSHLQKLAAALSGALEPGGLLADASLREVAAALSQRLDHFSHRSVIIASTMDELRERLECMAEGRDFPLTDRRAAPQIISGIAQSKRKIAFTMTGQGGQWWEMGRELIRTEPVFRKTIEHFDRHFVPVGGWSVMAELMADEADSHIDDAAITPAVMFAFQTGLANIWRRNGVRPDIVLGHSFGEVTAAFLAGGIREASVAKLVTHRGLIRGAVDRRGTMDAIGLGA